MTADLMDSSLVEMRVQQKQMVVMKVEMRALNLAVRKAGLI